MAFLQLLGNGDLFNQEELNGILTQLVALMHGKHSWKTIAKKERK